VSLKEDGADHVRVIVQVPAMPAYVEAMILDRSAASSSRSSGRRRLGSSP